MSLITFASVNASGYFGFYTQKLNLIWFITGLKANGVKVFLSINGAHADFAKACASPSSRLIFINDVMKKLVC